MFGHSDEEGLGAVGALFSLDGEDQVPIVCIGGEDDARRALTAGKLMACVEVTPYFADAVLSAIRSDEAGQPVEKLQLTRGAARGASDEPYARGY